MVKCKIGFRSLLTKGKEYEVIKKGHNFYVIKRDDGSIDRMDKTRFEDIKDM